MTRDEILNMQAGRELDALISMHIFGKNPELRMDFTTKTSTELCIAHYSYSAPVHVFKTQDGYFSVLPRYSTDIAAAWQVVEKLRETMYFVSISASADCGASWLCEWTTADTAIDFVRAGTMPLAVCRAALLAVTP